MRTIMVDTPARKKFAVLLKKFMSGELSNFEFEKELPDSEDPVLWAMATSVWCLYDDFKEHVLQDEDRLPKEVIERWMLFLQSEQEYEWPAFTYPGIRPLDHGFVARVLGAEKKEKEFMKLGDYEVWPFISNELFARAVKEVSGNG